MKSVSLITVTLLLLAAAVISSGCTGNPSSASVTEDTVLPTATPPVNRGVPVVEPTAAPTVTATVTPTAAPTEQSTVSPAPESSSSPDSITEGADGKVIYDERKGVLIGNILAIKFDENLDIPFLYRDEKYLIEVKSTKPVNVLFMQMTEYDANAYTPPKWDSVKGEWKYNGKMISQFDNTLQKTFEVTIPRIGKYCLFIDARNTDKDVLIERESVATDIRITKLN